MANAFAVEKNKLVGYAPIKLAGSMIAGGALTSVFTNQPINDIDLYFKTRQAFEEAVRNLYDDGFWCVDMSDRAITFVEGPAIVQLMHFDFFPTAQDVFNTFDFTCCMAALDRDGDAFVFDDRFFQHCSQRFLSFHPGTRYPFASLLRVLKYQGRGYTIGKGDLLKILLACHRTPVKSWDDLKSQIGGSYGHHVSLKADTPFSIEAAIEAIGDISFQAKTESAAEMPGSADLALEKIFGPQQIAA